MVVHYRRMPIPRLSSNKLRFVADDYNWLPNCWSGRSPIPIARNETHINKCLLFNRLITIVKRQSHYQHHCLGRIDPATTGHRHSHRALAAVGWPNHPAHDDPFPLDSELDELIRPPYSTTIEPPKFYDPISFCLGRIRYESLSSETYCQLCNK